MSTFTEVLIQDIQKSNKAVWGKQELIRFIKDKQIKYLEKKHGIGKEKIDEKSN